MNLADLKSKTLAQLKEIAKQMEIKGTTGLKKDELVEKIYSFSNSSLESQTITFKENSVEKVEEKHKSPNQEQMSNSLLQEGILEVMADGYGFLRTENFLPGSGDIYVSPSQIRRFNLKTGDSVKGNIRLPKDNEKFAALLYVKSINGDDPDKASKRPNFEAFHLSKRKASS